MIGLRHMRVTCNELLIIFSQDAPKFVVPDLKNFVDKLAFARAESMFKKVQEENQQKLDRGELNVKKREEIGLQIVAEVVDLFLQDGSLNKVVECLQNKSAARIMFGELAVWG